MAITIKLPEIPKNINTEMYNYYVQLHLNLKMIVDAINALEDK